MTANRRRGEIAATLDGKSYRLCLTLGALAELETSFGVHDLNALLARFGKGRLSATDMTRIIGAGLRAAGHDIADGDVSRLHHEDGVAGFARIVTDLLAATFGSAGEQETPSNP